MQEQSKKKKHKQKPILVCQIWEYGTTPTKNVQGQLKLKWAFLIKHLADADITHARIQMQGSMPNQRFIPICLYWKGIGNNIEKKSESKVQAQIRSS